MARSQWGSRLGFILASAGSAIGLGAVWKFPYVTATQGGGAFLLIYLFISLTLGLILMATEMAIGRATHLGPIGAFRKLGNNKWSIIGIMGVLVAFFILSFYSVVGGWTVAYLVKSMTGSIAGSTDPTINGNLFSSFITDPWQPLIYHFIFGFLTLFTVVSGVEKGIERIGRPLSDIQTAVENMGNVEVARLEKGLPILATVAGGAPMIGFLGTVMGMVQAFFNMAQAGNNIDITLLSGGIYVAMVTTVGGLIVGIIAYFGYNYLTSNISDLVFKMESTIIDFMDLLHEPAEEGGDAEGKEL